MDKVVLVPNHGKEFHHIISSFDYYVNSVLSRLLIWVGFFFLVWFTPSFPPLLLWMFGSNHDIEDFLFFFFFLNDLLLDHNNGMCFSSVLSLFSYWVFPVIFSASSILSTKPNGLVCIHLRWLYTIVDRSRTVDSIARLPFLCRYKNRLLFFLPFRNIVGYRRISFATYSGRWNTREISGNTTWLW